MNDTSYIFASYAITAVLLLTLIAATLLRAKRTKQSIKSMHHEA